MLKEAAQNAMTSVQSSQIVWPGVVSTLYTAVHCCTLVYTGVHMCLHAVPLIGGHPLVGVVEGPCRGRGGSSIAQHQLRLGVCNGNSQSSQSRMQDRKLKTETRYVVLPWDFRVEVTCHGLGIIWLWEKDETAHSPITPRPGHTVS